MPDVRSFPLSGCILQDYVNENKQCKRDLYDLSDFILYLVPVNYPGPGNILHHICNIFYTYHCHVTFLHF